MKAPILLRRVVLLLLLTAPTALAGDQLFDSLKLGDKTVTDAIVTDVTPTHVTVTYDGGTSKIKRQDLPPELKSLYPYDAKAAADYEKRQGKVLFDSLKVGDTTVTNVRVKDPTPTRVTVVFDGGCFRLKRQDLPDELKALYPYDPKEAAEYEKQQSSKQDEASADARANKRASLEKQRSAIEARITDLRKQKEQFQREMLPQKAKANGKPHSAARMVLDQSRNQVQDFIHKIGEQKEYLDRVNKQLDDLATADESKK